MRAPWTWTPSSSRAAAAGLDIELSPDELIRLTGARTARIGTGRNQGMN